MPGRAALERARERPPFVLKKGNGDLRYFIAVRGNTFRETGGDEGILTGIFVGRNHEGATGTLERTDLVGAFGGIRN